MFINGLNNYFNNIVKQPADNTLNRQKLEWITKYETVRALIYTVLSVEIHKYIKHHGYNSSLIVAEIFFFCGEIY
jgi:hypothetical protein